VPAPEADRHVAAREWHVGSLPFLITCGATPSNEPLGVPDRLPFVLEQDGTTGVLRQKHDDAVERALEAGYREGAVISGVMDDSGIGQRYALDFLAYIERQIPALRGKRVLEIGCGTGYLLSLLRDRGATVIGVEPGRHGVEGAKRFGVQVLPGFFPSPQITGEFDLVIAYAVIEHLSDVAKFLAEIRAALTADGIAILAAPDCRPYLAAGDLSCLIHQHWSYFTAATLRATVERSGFSAEITEAGFGGSLYCTARRAGGAPTKPPAADERGLERYRMASGSMLEKLRTLLSTHAASDQSLGIYVPGRIINALAVLGTDRGAQRLRFFDDNPQMRGLFYPGFPYPIEGWQEYLDRPATTMLIMSNTFGGTIRARIEALGGRHVLGWDDLFTDTAS
jgi:SAM-dependent methyltransferase